MSPEGHSLLFVQGASNEVTEPQRLVALVLKQH